MTNSKHLLLDIHGCDREILNNYEKLECIMYEALHLTNAKLLRMIGEKFEPQGVTLLALLAESHCSIHTWPEMGFAAVDFYTCGEEFDSFALTNMLRDKLKAETVIKKDIDRPTIIQNYV